MNKILRLVEVVVGVAFFLMGIGAVGFILPVFNEPDWLSSLLPVHFGFAGGAILLIGIGLLMILRKPQNSVLHLVATLLLAIPAMGYIVGLMPAIREGNSLIIFTVGPFGLVFLGAVVICIYRVVIFWSKKKPPSS
jgi:hypothetical protein